MIAVMGAAGRVGGHVADRLLSGDRHIRMLEDFLQDALAPSRA